MPGRRASPGRGHPGASGSGPSSSTKNVLSAYTRRSWIRRCCCAIRRCGTLTAPDVIDFQDTLELTNSVATDDFPGEKIARVHRRRRDAAPPGPRPTATPVRRARGTLPIPTPPPATKRSNCCATPMARRARSARPAGAGPDDSQIARRPRCHRPPARIHDELSTQVPQGHRAITAVTTPRRSASRRGCTCRRDTPTPGRPSSGSRHRRLGDQMPRPLGTRPDRRRRPGDLARAMMSSRTLTSAAVVTAVSGNPRRDKTVRTVGPPGTDPERRRCR